MSRLVRQALALLVLTTFWPTLVFGQAFRAGIVTTLEGTVTVNRAAVPQPIPLKFKDDVFMQDRLTTGDRSLARLLLGGKAVVSIRERSSLTITEVPGKSTIDLESGKIALAVAREKMKPGDQIEIRTPNAVAGIRGTVVVAEVVQASAQVGVGAQRPAVVTNFYVLRGSVTAVTIDPTTRAPVGPPATIPVGQSFRQTGTAPSVVAPNPPVSVITSGLTATTLPTAPSDPGQGQQEMQKAVTLSQALGLSEPTGDQQTTDEDKKQAEEVTKGLSGTTGPEGPQFDFTQTGCITCAPIIPDFGGGGGGGGTVTVFGVPKGVIAPGFTDISGIDNAQIASHLFNFGPGNQELGRPLLTTFGGVPSVDKPVDIDESPGNTDAGKAAMVIRGPAINITGSSLLNIVGNVTSKATDTLVKLDPTRLTSRNDVIHLGPGASLVVGTSVLSDVGGTLTAANAINRTETVSGASGVGANRSGNLVYVTSAAGNSVTSLNFFENSLPVVSPPIAVDLAPKAVAVSPEGSRALVVNAGTGGVTATPALNEDGTPKLVNGLPGVNIQTTEGTVSVIDTDRQSPTFNTNLGQRPVGSTPVAVVADARDPAKAGDTDTRRFFYVANQGPGALNLTAEQRQACGDHCRTYISVFDTRSVQDRLHTIALSDGVVPVALAVSPSNDRLFILDRAGSITVVTNPGLKDSHQVLTQTIPVGADPSAIALNADGTKVYVANRAGNSITAITLNTSGGVASTAIIRESGDLRLSAPSSLVTDSQRQRLFVVNERTVDGTKTVFVSIINTLDDKIVDEVVVPGETVASGIAIAPDGSRLYVTSTVSNRVSILDVEGGGSFLSIAARAQLVNTSDTPLLKFNGSTVTTINEFARIEGPTATTQMPDGSVVSLPSLSLAGSLVEATGSTFTVGTAAAPQPFMSVTGGGMVTQASSSPLFSFTDSTVTVHGGKPLIEVSGSGSSVTTAAAALRATNTDLSSFFNGFFTVGAGSSLTVGSLVDFTTPLVADGLPTLATVENGGHLTVSGGSIARIADGALMATALITGEAGSVINLTGGSMLDLSDATVTLESIFAGNGIVNITPSTTEALIKMAAASHFALTGTDPLLDLMTNRTLGGALRMTGGGTATFAGSLVRIADNVVLTLTGPLVRVLGGTATIEGSLIAFGGVTPGSASVVSGASANQVAPNVTFAGLPLNVGQGGAANLGVLAGFNTDLIVANAIVKSALTSSLIAVQGSGATAGVVNVALNVADFPVGLTFVSQANLGPFAPLTPGGPSPVVVDDGVRFTVGETGALGVNLPLGSTIAVNESGQLTIALSQAFLNAHPGLQIKAIPLRTVQNANLVLDSLTALTTVLPGVDDPTTPDVNEATRNIVRFDFASAPFVRATGPNPNISGLIGGATIELAPLANGTRSRLVAGRSEEGDVPGLFEVAGTNVTTVGPLMGVVGSDLVSERQLLRFTGMATLGGALDLSSQGTAVFRDTDVIAVPDGGTLRTTASLFNLFQGSLLETTGGSLVAAGANTLTQLTAPILTARDSNVVLHGAVLSVMDSLKTEETPNRGVQASSSLVTLDRSSLSFGDATALLTASASSVDQTRLAPLFRLTDSTIGQGTLYGGEVTLTPRSLVDLSGGSTMSIASSVLSMTGASTVSLSGAVVQLHGGDTFTRTAGPSVFMSGGTTPATRASLTAHALLGAGPGDTVNTTGGFFDLTNADVVLNTLVDAPGATRTLTLAPGDALARMTNSTLDLEGLIGMRGTIDSPGRFARTTGTSTLTRPMIEISGHDVTVTGGAFLRAVNATVSVTGASLLNFIQSSLAQNGRLLDADRSTFTLSHALAAFTDGSVLNHTAGPLVRLTNSTLVADTLLSLDSGSVAFATLPVLDLTNSAVTLRAFVDDPSRLIQTPAGTEPVVRLSNSTLQLAGMSDVHAGGTFARIEGVNTFTGPAIRLDGTTLMVNGAHDLMSLGSSLLGTALSTKGAAVTLGGAVAKVDGANVTVGGSLVDMTGGTLTTPAALLSLAGGARFENSASPLVRMRGGELSAGTILQSDGIANTLVLRGPVLDLGAGATVSLTGSSLGDATTTFALGANVPQIRMDASTLTLTTADPTESLVGLGSDMTFAPALTGVITQSGVALIATGGSTLNLNAVLLDLGGVALTDTNPQVQLTGSTVDQTGGSALISVFGQPVTLTASLMSSTDSAISTTSRVLRVGANGELASLTKTGPGTRTLLSFTGGTLSTGGDFAHIGSAGAAAPATVALGNSDVLVRFTDMVRRPDMTSPVTVGSGVLVRLSDGASLTTGTVVDVVRSVVELSGPVVLLEGAGTKLTTASTIATVTGTLLPPPGLVPVPFGDPTRASLTADALASGGMHTSAGTGTTVDFAGKLLQATDADVTLRALIDSDGLARPSATDTMLDLVRSSLRVDSTIPVGRISGAVTLAGVLRAQGATDRSTQFGGSLLQLATNAVLTLTRPMVDVLEGAKVEIAGALAQATGAATIRLAQTSPAATTLTFLGMPLAISQGAEVDLGVLAGFRRTPVLSDSIVLRGPDPTPLTPIGNLISAAGAGTHLTVGLADADLELGFRAVTNASLKLADGSTVVADGIKFELGALTVDLPVGTVIEVVDGRLRLVVPAGFADIPPTPLKTIQIAALSIDAGAALVRTVQADSNIVRILPDADVIRDVDGVLTLIAPFVQGEGPSPDISGLIGGPTIEIAPLAGGGRSVVTALGGGGGPLFDLASDSVSALGSLLSITGSDLVTDRPLLSFARVATIGSALDLRDGATATFRATDVVSVPVSGRLQTTDALFRLFGGSTLATTPLEFDGSIVAGAGTLIGQSAASLLVLGAPAILASHSTVTLGGSLYASAFSHRTTAAPASPDFGLLANSSLVDLDHSTMTLTGAFFTPVVTAFAGTLDFARATPVFKLTDSTLTQTALEDGGMTLLNLSNSSALTAASSILQATRSQVTLAGPVISLSESALNLTGTAPGIHLDASTMNVTGGILHSVNSGTSMNGPFVRLANGSTLDVSGSTFMVSGRPVEGDSLTASSLVSLAGNGNTLRVGGTLLDASSDATVVLFSLVQQDAGATNTIQYSLEAFDPVVRLSEATIGYGPLTGPADPIVRFGADSGPTVTQDGVALVAIGNADRRSVIDTTAPILRLGNVALTSDLAQVTLIETDVLQQGTGSLIEVTGQATSLGTLLFSVNSALTVPALLDVTGSFSRETAGLPILDLSGGSVTSPNTLIRIFGPSARAELEVGGAPLLSAFDVTFNTPANQPLVTIHNATVYTGAAVPATPAPLLDLFGGSLPSARVQVSGGSIVEIDGLLRANGTTFTPLATDRLLDISGASRVSLAGPIADLTDVTLDLGTTAGVATLSGGSTLETAPNTTFVTMSGGSLTAGALVATTGTGNTVDLQGTLLDLFNASVTLQALAMSDATGDTLRSTLSENQALIAMNQSQLTLTGAGVPLVRFGVDSGNPVEQPGVAITTSGVSDARSTIGIDGTLLALGGVTLTSPLAQISLVETDVTLGRGSLVEVSGLPVESRGSLLFAASSAITGGGSLFDVRGQLTQTGTNAALASLTEATVDVAGDLLRISGGSVALSGTLLATSGGDLSAGANLLGVTAGGSLTGGSGSPVIDLFGGALRVGAADAGHLIFVEGAGSTIDVNGGLLRATGTELSLSGVDGALLVEVIGVAGSASPTSVKTGNAVVELVSTAIVNGNVPLAFVSDGTLQSHFGPVFRIIDSTVESGPVFTLRSATLEGGDGLLHLIAASATVPRLIDAVGASIAARDPEFGSLRSLVDLFGSGSTFRNTESGLVRLTDSSLIAAKLVTAFAPDTVNLTGTLLDLTGSVAMLHGLIGGDGAVTHTLADEPIVRMTNSRLQLSGFTTVGVPGTFARIEGQNPAVAPFGIPDDGVLISLVNTALTVQDGRDLVEFVGPVSVEAGVLLVGGSGVVTVEPGLGGAASAFRLRDGAPVTVGGPLLQLSGRSSMTIAAAVVTLEGGSTLDSSAPAMIVVRGGSTLTADALFQADGMGNIVTLQGGLLDVTEGSAVTLQAFGRGEGTFSMQLAPGQALIRMDAGTLTMQGPGEPLVSLGSDTGVDTVHGVALIATNFSLVNVAGPLLDLGGANLVDTNAQIQLTDSFVRQTGADPLITIFGQPVTVAGGLIAATDSLIINEGTPLIGVGGAFTAGEHPLVALTFTPVTAGGILSVCCADANATLGASLLDAVDSTITLSGAAVEIGPGGTLTQTSGVPLISLVGSPMTSGHLLDLCCGTATLTLADAFLIATESALTGALVDVGGTLTTTSDVPFLQLVASPTTGLGIDIFGGTTTLAGGLLFAVDSTITLDPVGIRIGSSTLTSTSTIDPLITLLRSDVTGSADLVRITDGASVTLAGGLADVTDSEVTLGDTFLTVDNAMLTTSGAGAGPLVRLANNAGGMQVATALGFVRFDQAIVTLDRPLLEAEFVDFVSGADADNLSIDAFLSFTGGSRVTTSSSAPFIQIAGGSVMTQADEDFLLVAGRDHGPSGAPSRLAVPGTLIRLTDDAMLSIGSGVLARVSDQAELSVGTLLDMMDTTLSLTSSTGMPGTVVRVEGGSTFSSTGTLVRVAGGDLTAATLVDWDGTGSASLGQLLDARDGAVVTLRQLVSGGAATFALAGELIVLDNARLVLTGPGMDTVAGTFARLDGLHRAVDPVVSISNLGLHVTSGDLLTIGSGLADTPGSPVTTEGALLVASQSMIDVAGAILSVPSDRSLAVGGDSVALDVTGGSVATGGDFITIGGGAGDPPPAANVEVAGGLLRFTDMVDGAVTVGSGTMIRVLNGSRLAVGGPALELTQSVLDLGPTGVLVDLAGGSAFEVGTAHAIRMAQSTLSADAIVRSDGTGNQLVLQGGLLDATSSVITVRAVWDQVVPIGEVSADIAVVSLAADTPFVRLVDSVLTVTSPDQALLALGSATGSVFEGVVLHAQGERNVAAGTYSTVVSLGGRLFTVDDSVITTTALALVSLAGTRVDQTGPASLVEIQDTGSLILTGSLLSATDSAIQVGGRLLDVAGGLASDVTPVLSFDSSSVTASLGIVRAVGENAALSLGGALVSAIDTNFTVTGDAAFLAIADGAVVEQVGDSPVIALTGTASYSPNVPGSVPTSSVNTTGNFVFIGTTTRQADLGEGDPLLKAPSVTLGGSLVWAEDTAFAVGAPTMSPRSFVAILDSAKVTGPPQGEGDVPLISLVSSSVDASGAFVTVRRSQQLADGSFDPTTLSLTGPLVVAENSRFTTFNTASGDACCSFLAISEGALVEALGTSTLMQFENSVFTDIGGSFVSVSDQSRFGDPAAPATLVLGGGLLRDVGGHYTVNGAMVRVVNGSSLSGSGTDALLDFTNSTVHAQGGLFTQLSRNDATSGGGFGEDDARNTTTVVLSGGLLRADDSTFTAGTPFVPGTPGTPGSLANFIGIRDGATFSQAGETTPLVDLVHSSVTASAHFMNVGYVTVDANNQPGTGSRITPIVDLAGQMLRMTAGSAVNVTFNVLNVTDDSILTATNAEPLIQVSASSISAGGVHPVTGAPQVGGLVNLAGTFAPGTPTPAPATTFAALAPMVTLINGGLFKATDSTITTTGTAFSILRGASLLSFAIGGDGESILEIPLIELVNSALTAGLAVGDAPAGSPFLDQRIVAVSGVASIDDFITPASVSNLGPLFVARDGSSITASGGLLVVTDGGFVQSSGARPLIEIDHSSVTVGTGTPSGSVSGFGTIVTAHACTAAPCNGVIDGALRKTGASIDISGPLLWMTDSTVDAARFVVRALGDFRSEAEGIDAGAIVTHATGTPYSLVLQRGGSLTVGTAAGSDAAVVLVQGFTENHFDADTETFLADQAPIRHAPNDANGGDAGGGALFEANDSTGTMPVIEVKGANGNVIRVDKALLEASAPLIALTGAHLTSSSDLIKVLNKARVESGAELVKLDRTTLHITNGHFLNVGDMSKVVANRLVTIGSNTFIGLSNGLLINIGAGGYAQFLDAIARFTGSNSSISITNAIAPTTVFNFGNIALPVSLGAGATIAGSNATNGNAFQGVNTSGNSVSVTGGGSAIAIGAGGKLVVGQ